MAFLDRISMLTAVLLALVLGLSPFIPEPHIWQKLKMLVDGTLVRPLDIFDLIFHSVPWLILFAKLARLAAGSGKA